MAKVNTKDWQGLPIEKWNATTYREYMKHLHQAIYGIPYVANNYAVEGRFITNMRKEHGNEVVKRFIEKCFELHSPSEKYPGLNFGFMYSYLRERYLPLVLKDIAREKYVSKRTNTKIDEEWF